MTYKNRNAAWAIASLVCCSGVAMGQPDVIVGDLTGPDHYTAGGAINGKHSYAVGTTSCNLGTQPLAWDDTTNQYPVISGNMYRLSNGRFQQIGQSWLKHGFCALQQTLCGTCTPGGNCDALFPGCSDPYSAGLNGNQGGLGPKREITASTGVFPANWNPAGTPEAGDTAPTLFKRVVVRQSDLAVSGAQFFMSSMYIQAQDAAAGNNNNNESYRVVSINPTTFAPTWLGSTQRQKPAIFAWRDHGLGFSQVDTSVILTPMDVPQDGKYVTGVGQELIPNNAVNGQFVPGRFWVGCKVISLPGGLYRYEYAVQNLNSDRSGQKFSVPLPAGAPVSNVGFSDVDYHSGEVYTNTDWTSQQGGADINWSGQTYAQNVNANALRWNTIYNFWFETPVPPVDGNITLTLFKPAPAGATNAPAAVTALVKTPDPNFNSTPTNDECYAAPLLANGSYSFNTLNASTSAADAGTEKDIWFAYTAACAGSTTMSITGAAFDSKISVYSFGNCPTASSTPIASNADAGSNNASVTLNATAGATYLIRIGGTSNTGGFGTLNLSGQSCATSSNSDECVSAGWISDGVPVTGSNVAATTTANFLATSCGSTASGDMWYKYRPVTTGNVIVNTCGSGFNTTVGIYSDCTGSAASYVQCNDDNASPGTSCVGTTQSYVSRTLTAGTTYYIRVAGRNNATGTFSLSVSGGGGVIPPANDFMVAAQPIGLGFNAINNVNASTDGPTHTTCSFTGDNQITSDVWYVYPSFCTGTLTVDTCQGIGFDTRLAIYEGTNTATLIGCNDNGPCGNGRSSATVSVQAGQSYLIRVGGVSNAQGAGTLSLSCVPVAGPTCNDLDFNNDGNIEPGDVDAYFSVLGEGPCLGGATCDSLDFNNDGNIEPEDVDAYFSVLGEGPCSNN